DLLQAVEEELRRRRFGEVVRLEIERGMATQLREHLVAALGIEDRQVYEVDGMLDFSDLTAIADLPGHGDLRYPPHSPATPPLVPGLIDAAERGKQAVCMVELKARFDERANIEWAKKLEEAGVHVVYGIPALKTHSKCVLVARREGDRVRHYVHVGTGNYNPK